jgi:hypothetical protein
MILKSFWSAITALLLSAFIALMPAPAFAAVTSINSSTAAGSFDLPATQDKDLPGFTNTSGKPVTVKIQAAGTWAFVNQSRQVSPEFEAFKVPFDGDGFKTKAGTTGTNPKLKYPRLPGGALVATVTNAKGELKAEVSGKDQSIELQPGESVKFGFNDETTEYADNAGSLKINYSVVAPCTVPTPVPPVPTPAPPVPTPVSCNLTGANAKANFLWNIPYKSFDDSPFKSLKASSDWFEFETFDGPTFQVDTKGVTASSPNETSKYTDPSFYDSVDSDDGAIDGKGRGQDRLVLSNGDITFTFDNKRGYPTDAGIVWTDVHATNPSFGESTLTFEAFDGSGKSLGLQGPVRVGGDYSTLGETGEDRFFGVHNNGGISSFRIVVPAVTVGVEFDHLQYGRKCL